MALRDDLYPIVDAIRADVVDGVAGLRYRTTALRVRSWSGLERGLGTATVVDTPIEPKPKVSGIPDERIREGGRYQAGDVSVSKISLTYTRADLEGSSIAATEEFYWVIDDEPYRLVEVEEGFLGWTATVRRVQV